MGSIPQRRRKDGPVARLAQISIMREGKSLRREDKTFERRSVANAWSTQREKELTQPEALNERARVKAVWRKPTLADAIDRYIEDSQKQMGRTTTQVLRTLKCCAPRCSSS